MRLLFAVPWVFAVAGCAASPDPRSDPSPSPADVDDTAPGSVLFAGERRPVPVAVVGPNDPGGYDASLERCRYRDAVRPSDPAPGCDTPRRYSERPGPPETLRDRIDLVVLHYDVAVTSRRCFEVLHDRRGLSSHFLVDVDGTVYQTLDLAHRARHAGPANDRSIGIEIAHVGAYEDATTAIDRFYRPVPGGLELRIPAEFGPPEGGPFHPARPRLVRGEIHGRSLVQPDYTNEQYEALAGLLEGLVAWFPRLEARAPREPSGEIPRRVLTEAELAAFRGVVGHYHLTESKVDPGPAFDWARLWARGVRE